jgi:cation diffusion facilitator family transporter
MNLLIKKDKVKKSMKADKIVSDNQNKINEKKSNKDIENKNLAMKVSFYSILGNVFLSIFKLLAGIIGKSGAMLSDAIHSLSDVFSTIVVIIGIKLASKAEDEKHQYGHERLECVAAIILAMSLIAVGIGIGISGIKNIVSGDYSSIAVPGVIALVAAVVSILTKEIMFWYTKIAAKKINSSALMADAWHHRSDSLSSIGSFIGILGARLGFLPADSIASVIICIFILKAGYDVFKDAVKKTIDEACDAETIEKITEIAVAQDGVVKVDMIKTRLFASKAYIDLEISVDGDKSLREAHAVAEHVHDAIEKNIEIVKHCMVHVNPA